MMKILIEKILTIKTAFNAYSKNERLFIFYAMGVGFCICCGYAIVRPISHSIFIESYTAKWFPYAWFALVPFNGIAVSFYNRLIAKWGSKRLMTSLIIGVIFFNVFFVFMHEIIPSLPFSFYLWKELYILLMFQLLWSVIHSNINLNRAKYLYGIFFGIGGLGSILGSSIPGFFAYCYGSANLLFLTVPIYLTLIYLYGRMSRVSVADRPSMQKEAVVGGIWHGVQLIRRSRFLIFALLSVVSMQVISTIIDFQFYDFLERIYTDKDMRTAYCARVMGVGHTLTVLLQFLGSFLLIQWIGLRNVHRLIPSVLGASAMLLMAFPRLSVAGGALIICKSIDFSLFGIVKEMLYIPLKPDEKFRAKAVIDVFAYRSAKALGSLLILSMSFFSAKIFLGWAALGIVLLWIAGVSYGLKESHKVATLEETP